MPVLIVLLSWHEIDLLPGTGIDKSWQAGLQMSIHNGIAFGDRSAFTYGPLGFFVGGGLWYTSLAAAGFAYLVLIRIALAGALFFAARRSLGTALGFVVALIVAASGDRIAESVITLIVLAWALPAPLEDRMRMWLCAGAGAFAGFELLIKLSVGLAIAAMAVVFALTVVSRRRVYVGATVLGFVATLLAGWLVSGQDLGALSHYLGNSAQISSGYGPAMSYGPSGIGWPQIAAGAALLIGCWAALTSTPLEAPTQRLGLALLWVVFWFFALKEGFVRYDATHAIVFFESIAAGLLAFRWPSSQRAALLISVAGFLGLALAATGASPSYLLDPAGNATVAVRDVRYLVSSSKRAQIMEYTRGVIQAQDPIDSYAFSLLRGRTVAAYPTEIALVWAYGLRWDPLPTWQSYVTYTPSLDRLDANFLGSSSAPQRIVMQPLGDIDGRILSFDAGFTNLAMLCRYAELYTTSRLTVLGAAADRCAQPRLLRSVRADWGQTVDVPPLPDAHSLVFVRIQGVQVSGFEDLVSLVYKPTQRYIVLNGGPPARLVEGTAGDGLPLRAAPGVDFKPPFNMAVGARTIAVRKGSSGRTGGTPITYSFYVQDFSRGSDGATVR